MCSTRKTRTDCNILGLPPQQKEGFSLLIVLIRGPGSLTGRPHATLNQSLYLERWILHWWVRSRRGRWPSLTGWLPKGNRGGRFRQNPRCPPQQSNILSRENTPGWSVINQTPSMLQPETPSRCQAPPVLALLSCRALTWDSPQLKPSDWLFDKLWTGTSS